MFRVEVILYRQRVAFMALVIDLIGQLNCNVIGSVRPVKADWCVLIRLLFWSVYC